MATPRDHMHTYAEATVRAPRRSLAGWERGQKKRMTNADEDVTHQVRLLLEEWRRRVCPEMEMDEFEAKWSDGGGQVFIPSDCRPFEILERAIITVPQWLQRRLFETLDGSVRI